ncbi:Unknown protein, partial [Striga hermonthica]
PTYFCKLHNNPTNLKQFHHNLKLYFKIPIRLLHLGKENGQNQSSTSSSSSLFFYIPNRPTPSSSPYESISEQYYYPNIYSNDLRSI